MLRRLFCILLGVVIACGSSSVFAYAPLQRVLIFVPYDQFDTGSYTTIVNEFTAKGYTIDTVSSMVGSANPENSANQVTVPTSSQANRSVLTGSSTIQTLSSSYIADNYDAFIVIGGEGAKDYFFDGVYVDSARVSSTVLKDAINALGSVVQTMTARQKPVGSIEKATGIIATIRKDGTRGVGFDGLGTSILQGIPVTTFDYDQTMHDLLVALGVTLLDGSQQPGVGPITGDGEPVVVSGQPTSPSTLITCRDSTSASYCASTITTMLSTFPSQQSLTARRSVVVFGGDEPWRYNIPYDLIAKHTDVALRLDTAKNPFTTSATADEYSFATQISSTTPPDAIVYFRMGSTANQTEINAKLASYVQAGGALLVLHHGLYNDQGNKGSLTSLSGLVGLVGGEIPSSLTSVDMDYPGPNRIINTNLGHYASTFALSSTTSTTYTDSNSPSSVGRINTVTGTYPYFDISPDEITGIITISPNAQITPLAANNATVSNDATRPVAWVRSVGKGYVGFYQPGERNDGALTGSSMQMIENMVRYMTKDQAISAPTSIATPTDGYRAKWVTQTQGSVPVPGQSFSAFQLHAGESAQISAEFLNAGSTTWYADTSRNDFVGFYVYKDPLYSTPLERNNPTNTLFGTSYFANATWGPNFVKTQNFTRAAVVQQASVAPGQTGKFVFTFTAPTSAVPNDDFDNPATKQSEFYYREDLTLATGPNWMLANCAWGKGIDCTGDPLGFSHVWFAIRIIR